MIKIRQFNEIDSKIICNSYLEGKTLTFLSQQFHCRTEAIKSILLKNNITIKKQKKNRQLKEDYFKKIDTEEKAYFLGLMFTDGNITLDTNRERSPMIRLTLKIDDYEILEKFRQELQMNTKLSYDKRKGKECAILSFRSKIMADDLKQYGIIPNKTYLTKHLPVIKTTYLKDFLRGLIDGDGSIYQETKSQKYRIDFCSYHKSICEDFVEYYYQLTNYKNNNKIAKYGTAFHIRFNAQNIVKQMATVLYKDSKISLARKYSLAEKLFEDKSENDIVYSDH